MKFAVGAGEHRPQVAGEAGDVVVVDLVDPGQPHQRTLVAQGLDNLRVLFAGLQRDDPIVLTLDHVHVEDRLECLPLVPAGQDVDTLGHRQAGRHQAEPVLAQVGDVVLRVAAQAKGLGQGVAVHADAVIEHVDQRDLVALVHALDLHGDLAGLGIDAVVDQVHDRGEAVVPHVPHRCHGAGGVGGNLDVRHLARCLGGRGRGRRLGRCLGCRLGSGLGRRGLALALGSAGACRSSGRHVAYLLSLFSCPVDPRPTRAAWI
jgi:hypothetical protein